jgi:hypothetical protein
MAKISDSELSALNETGPLLRFAAEHVKELNPELPLAIAQAQQAMADGQWSPQMSQQFWNTFAKLCDLIQPVTMDTLEAAQQKIPPSPLLERFGAGPRSIAQRSSGRYLLMLFLLLGLILPVQLYVWTCTNLSKKVDDLIASQKSQYLSLVQESNKLELEAKSLSPEKSSQELAVAATSFRSLTYQISAETRLLERVLTLGLSALPDTKKSTGDSMPAKLGDYYQIATDEINRTQSLVVQVQENANLVVGILGAYILPILFGAIGAVAYIIRTISEQIRASTFSASSPTRHIMRTALGAMAGVVVGLFSDLSTKLSLPPLAVAFLAGYGVEAVFSMFDGFIAKFK